MKPIASMTPEEKEAFHAEAEARVKTFKYEKPQPTGKPKDIQWMVQSGLIKQLVQVVRDGGENNLHYHTNSETTWMVLSGSVRFYGPGDTVIAELGPNEGILLPGGARYWFEKVGEGDLELLQTIAVERSSGSDQRINVERHKDWMESDKFLKVYENSATG
jgi:mannose-6-phosphate isomerase-like protein (cupin superfamily)